MNPEAPSKFEEARALASRAGKELFASLSPEEKIAHVAALRAARLAAIARKRAAGESVDFLTHEQRREIGRKGGMASAKVRIAPKFHGLAAAQLAAARSVYSKKRAALRPPADPVLQPDEQRFVRERLITLPRTSPNRANFLKPDCWLKLLHHIEPDDDALGGGFGFEGKVLRPGALLPEGELWPDRSYPATPLILESAGRMKENSETLYLLWRLQARQWHEIARMSSPRGEWSSLLRPLAINELGAPKHRKSIDVRALTERTETWLERETGALSCEDRNSFWSMIHDVIAARIAAGLPKRPAAHFEVIEVTAISDEKEDTR